jgi:RHS repeat-associated protein
MNGAINANFVYGAFGRRASKTINGTATAFLYDGLNPVHELQGDSPTANILTGLGIDEYFQRIDSNGASNLPIDALESTLSLADSTGTVRTSYTYEPFGNTAARGASSTNPFQFTGRENHGSGLHFYRARYYSPTFQRFIGQDPIDFAGGETDLYGYVGNNPASHRDEMGEGPYTGFAVGIACAGYIAYSYYSNLAELNKLAQQQQQIGQQINALRQQQDSCNDAEKQEELDQQIEPLEQQFQNLAGQYAAAHAADSFSDEAKIAACVLATRLAFLSPLP